MRLATISSPFINNLFCSNHQNSAKGIATASDRGESAPHLDGLQSLWCLMRGGEYISTKPRGSEDTAALTSGGLREMYRWLLPKSRLSSVVLPDWRGPVSTTTGNSRAAFFNTGSIVLRINFYLMDTQSLSCNYAFRMHNYTTKVKSKNMGSVPA